MTRKAAVLLVLAHAVACSLGLTIPPKDGVATPLTARALLPNCDDAVLDPTCMKLGVVRLLESLTASKYSLLPGVSFERTSEAASDEASSDEKLREIARSFPNDLIEQVDSYLAYKIGTFLENHSLKLNLIDEETSRALKTVDNEVETEEGRGKKKKKKLKLLALALGIGGIIKKAIAGAMIVGTYIIAKKALILSIIAIVSIIATSVGGSGGGLGSLFGKKSEGYGGNGGGGYHSAAGNGGSSWSSASGGGADYSAHPGYARSAGQQQVQFELPAKLR